MISGLTPTNGLEYGLTVATLVLVSTTSQDIHAVWLLVPFAATLLFLIDRASGLRDVVLIGLFLLIAIYLGYPGLKNRIFAGSLEFMATGELLGIVQTFSTGAYLYGFVALEILLVAVLWWHKRRQIT